MRNVSVITLIGRAQRRADRESDASITASEWKEILSGVVGEMHGVVNDAGFLYVASEATINLTTFALPTDHLATWSVEYEDSAGNRRTLTELQPSDRARFRGKRGEAYFYIVVGQVVEMYPTPTSGTYKMVYIPQSADLSAASDSAQVDVVNPDGEDFVLWGMAVKARSKSTDEVAVAMGEREVARGRLFAWAVQRSFSTPRHAEPVDDYDPRRRWRP